MCGLARLIIDTFIKYSYHLGYRGEHSQACQKECLMPDARIFFHSVESGSNLADLSGFLIFLTVCFFWWLLGVFSMKNLSKTSCSVSPVSTNHENGPLIVGMSLTNLDVCHWTGLTEVNNLQARVSMEAAPTSSECSSHWRQ